MDTREPYSLHEDYRIAWTRKLCVSTLGHCPTPYERLSVARMNLPLFNTSRGSNRMAARAARVSTGGTMAGTPTESNEIQMKFRPATRTLRKKLTQTDSERAQLMKEGRCFKCRASGHLVKNCPEVLPNHGDPAADQIVRGPSGCVTVILSQRPTPGTIEYSTNRFCGETYVLAGVLKSQDFKLSFGAKSFVLGKKLAKLRKEEDRWSQPAPTVGPTAPTVGPMQVSVHREIFNFSWRVAKSVLSSTVRRWNVKKKKKERTKERKTVAKGKEKIFLLFFAGLALTLHSSWIMDTIRWLHRL